MMITSAVPGPAPTWPAPVGPPGTAPAPASSATALTVTTAWTSVAPSLRYSFWLTSLLNVTIEVSRCEVVRYIKDDDGDVVVSTGT